MLLVFTLLFLFRLQASGFRLRLFHRRSLYEHLYYTLLACKPQSFPSLDWVPVTSSSPHPLLLTRASARAGQHARLVVRLARAPPLLGRHAAILRARHQSAPSSSRRDSFTSTHDVPPRPRPARHLAPLTCVRGSWSVCRLPPGDALALAMWRARARGGWSGAWSAISRGTATAAV